MPLFNKLYISIHAPTRGATIKYSIKPLKSSISIHAPTRGATQFLEGLTIQTLFQSTLLQEERRLLLFLLITFHVFQSTLLQEERQ